jgi:hypothetical protein
LIAGRYAPAAKIKITKSSGVLFSLGGTMNTQTRQPDLSALDALLAYNRTLPQLALDAAALGDIDLARAYIRLAERRGVECGKIALVIEQMAKGSQS